LFGRQVQAIGPEGRVAEPLRSRRVPTGKRHETNFLKREPECVDRSMIGPRVRLEGSESVHAQHLLEESLQPRVSDGSIQNLGRRVREEPQPNPGPLKVREDAIDVGPGRQLQVRLYQLLALVTRELQLEQVRGEDQSIFGCLPEI